MTEPADRLSRGGQCRAVARPVREISVDARPGRRCASCGAAVPWRVQRFCLDLRDRFGGRVYCMSCQRAFPPE